MKSLSLSAKILLSNAALVLLTIGAVGVSIYFNQQQIISAKRINALAELTSKDLPELVLNVKKIQINIIQVQQFLTDVSATRAQDGLDDGFEDAAKNAKQFDDTVAATSALAARLKAGEVQQTLEKVKAAFVPYYEDGQRMAKLYVAEGPSAGNKMMAEFDKRSEAMANAVEELIAIAEKLSKQGQMEIDQATDMATDRLQQLSWILYALVVVALLLGAALAVISHLNISTPIKRATRIMRVLAGGKTDIEVQDIGRRDEIGEMAKSVLTFRDSAIENEQLRQNQILAEAEALKIRKNTILEMAATVERETAKAVQEIEAKANVVDLAAEDMSKIASNVSDDTQSVSAASEEALTNSQTVSAAAEQLARSIQEIGAQVRNTTEVTRLAVQSGQAATGTIASLTKAITKISQVTKLIGDIAEQTNLLALNATIESARAGDAGRGFAVVAAEVKNLAQQTAHSTEDINQQIMEVQSFTQAAVRAIDEVGSRIQQIDTAATAIAEAVEQQGISTREIAHNVSQAALAAREVSSKIQNVSSGAQHVDDRARGVRTSIGEVTDKVGVLREVLVRVVRSSTGDADRRAAPRYLFDGKSEVLDRLERPLDGELIDISATGASLRCRPAMQAGETGKLRLDGLTFALPFIVRGSHAAGLRAEFELTEDMAKTYQTWLNSRVGRDQLREAA